MRDGNTQQAIAGIRQCLTTALLLHLSSRIVVHISFFSRNFVGSDDNDNCSFSVLFQEANYMNLRLSLNRHNSLLSQINLFVLIVLFIDNLLHQQNIPFEIKF